MDGEKTMVPSKVIFKPSKIPEKLFLLYSLFYSEFDLHIQTIFTKKANLAF